MCINYRIVVIVFVYFMLYSLELVLKKLIKDYKDNKAHGTYVRLMLYVVQRSIQMSTNLGSHFSTLSGTFGVDSINL